MKKLALMSILTALCLSCFVGCGKESYVPSNTPAAQNPSTMPVLSSAEPVPASAEGVAVVIHGTEYSVELCNIYFAGLYYDFLNTYGDYASVFGLDASAGIVSLKEQRCEYSGDGTWYGYFLDSAVAMMAQTEALCDYAAANGITLAEQQSHDIEELFLGFDDLTIRNGFEDHNAYLTAVYGQGVTDELYRAYLEKTMLADAAYETYCERLSFTEQEIDENYAQMGYAEGENEYPVTAMRHILIMAEADENGEYSDEAIAAAHRAAETVYEQWKNGTRTEESFAELANKHSDDGGSNSNGGLYKEIFRGQMVSGIDEWLFAEDRREGDTALIDNKGSYVGTHIVYFLGQGELYSRLLSLEDLQADRVEAWFTALMEDYTVEEGPAYGRIGAIA